MHEDANSPVRPSAPRKAPLVRLALGVVATAAGAAMFAVAFRWTLSFALRHLFHAPNVVAAMEALPLWARVLVPAAGGLCSGLVSLLVTRGAQGHGVGDVMEAVVLGRVHLSMRATLVKSVASWLAIVGGGSIGREGPLIRFGGAWGEAVSRPLGLETEKAQLIACGTAAGFAAAYNTPFAAVLFVIEIVMGVIVPTMIVPVVIATAISVGVTRALIGEGPLYGQRAFHLASPIELVAFAALGLVAALGSHAFTQLLAFGERVFARSWLRLPWRPALGGLVAGLFVCVLPSVAGNGYEPLNALLDGNAALGLVGFLLVGKAFATTASVSAGSPGGVFTPVLLVGGCVGLAFAAVLGRIVPLGAAGGYALVGMAATTAATTHAPLMAAVMIFELSGDYAIALPLMVATAVATLLSRVLREDSIYTAELRRKGIAWEMTMEGRRRTEPKTVSSRAP